jgi:hypothetical protein
MAIRDNALYQYYVLSSLSDVEGQAYLLYHCICPKGHDGTFSDSFKKYLGYDDAFTRFVWSRFSIKKLKRAGFFFRFIRVYGICYINSNP